MKEFISDFKIYFYIEKDLIMPLCWFLLLLLFFFALKARFRNGACEIANRSFSRVDFGNETKLKLAGNKEKKRKRNYCRVWSAEQPTHGGSCIHLKSEQRTKI